MLKLLRGGLFARLCVLPAEALDAARGINQLLFAGEERVAVGADFHRDVAFVRGTRSEIVAAGAVHLYRLICWMNASLHDFPNLSLQKVILQECCGIEQAAPHFESFSRFTQHSNCVAEEYSPDAATYSGFASSYPPTYDTVGDCCYFPKKHVANYRQ
jgi:hypothetical protein